MGRILRQSSAPLPKTQPAHHNSPQTLERHPMILETLKYAKYYNGVLWKNWTKTQTSYAQHGEDLLVESLLGKVNSFIDVGANDGALFSNTYRFAKTGAKGICIEPSRSCFLKLKLNHLFHFHTKCLQLAVSDKEGTTYLTEEGYENVLSVVSTDNSLNNYPVKTTSLFALLERYPQFKDADLVSIDVEGHEEQVIVGAGNSLWNSKLIILEVDKSNLEKMLSLPALQNHYPAYSNGINLILLNKQERQKKPSFLPEGFYQC